MELKKGRELKKPRQGRKLQLATRHLQIYDMGHYGC